MGNPKIKLLFIYPYKIDYRKKIDETPKRPASDDITDMLDDTPRRKLIKTSQQKENNTISPLRNELELPQVPSTNNEE
ncbi:unnamed protein product, partial [Rotaria sp. Silwood1]